MIEMKFVVKERVVLPTKSYAIHTQENDQSSHKKNLKIRFWKHHQNHKHTQSNKTFDEKLVFKPCSNNLEQKYNEKSNIDFWNNARSRGPTQLSKEPIEPPKNPQFGYSSDWSTSRGR